MIKIIDFNNVNKDDLFIRSDNKTGVAETVTEIIEKVKSEGDNALRFYSEKFDSVKLDSLEVSDDEFKEAFNIVDKDFIEVLKKASENIRSFHSKQVRQSFISTEKEGVICGQRIIPIEKVGLYVPGGTAAYPSSVLMNCIPAKIAGCKKIVMVTPPKKDGKVNPNILVAASLAGVDKVYKIGGAQAIAALAYGTESVMAVDKIVGPGNAFVAEAKKQVFGRVAIDMIAGPSEILVIADKTNNPRHIAADLLSQAEHDKMATAVLITDDKDFASKVSAQLEEQIPLLSRSEIARTSIDNNGKIIIADDLYKAVEISNELAPEHLEICTDNPFDYLNKVTNAGSVFLGKNCPEALGDYFAGPNHTLPTSGTAKFSSPLSVDDFVKKSQYTYFTADALKAVADDVALFADTEGLTAHAKSVTVRGEDK
ncbi:MAG: histidinol dehydrogenase [Acutalibacteraceae bacterium]